MHMCPHVRTLTNTHTHTHTHTPGTICNRRLIKTKVIVVKVSRPSIYRDGNTPHTHDHGMIMYYDSGSLTLRKK